MCDKHNIKSKIKKEIDVNVHVKVIIKMITKIKLELKISGWQKAIYAVWYATKGWPETKKLQTRPKPKETK